MRDKYEGCVSRENKGMVASSFGVSNEDLPILKHKCEILELVRTNQVIIIVGETGSGKSTQISQFLFDAGYHKYGLIGCTQPRRIAAVNIAKRVEEEMNRGVVGYSIRFEDETDKRTRIKYMTEGILLRELAADKYLKSYSVVVVDEVHERSVNIDIILGMLKRILMKRRDLKVIIMSATMNHGKISSFFNSPLVYFVEGRSHPVDIKYLRVNVDDYVERIVKQIIFIHKNKERGNILVFVTGKEDSSGIVKIINGEVGGCMNQAKEILIAFPLYSQLSNEQQEVAFKEEHGVRKCIVSTNIAETSLTVSNVKFVIDSGLCKVKVYKPSIGMDALITAPISQASANQRSGRAGRTAPGVCYRMYTEKTFKDEFLEEPVPEIRRTNLINAILALKRLNVDDVFTFSLIDPPSHGNVVHSLNLLWILGALDDSGCLTRGGKVMSEFPLDLMLSKMLVCGIEYGCIYEMVVLVSLLSTDGILLDGKSGEYRNRRIVFHERESDHLMLLNIFYEYERSRNKERFCEEYGINQKEIERAIKIKKQMERIVRQSGVMIGKSRSVENTKMCICSSLYFNVARKKGNKYVALNSGAACKLNVNSSLRESTPEYIVYQQFFMAKVEYFCLATSVNPEWLIGMKPQLYTPWENHWDGEQGAYTPREECFKLKGMFDGDLRDRFERDGPENSCIGEKRYKRPLPF
jgi:pre-mRNA-splicing factor ATP-dependent RNA helicase DHX38/PRP16